jgi:hypothetical protein
LPRLTVTGSKRWRTSPSFSGWETRCTRGARLAMPDGKSSSLR